MTLPALALLDRRIVGVNEPSRDFIEFKEIPQEFGDLVVKLRARLASNATNGWNWLVTFNDIAGTSYMWAQVRKEGDGTDGTSNSFSASAAQMADICNSDSPAGFGNTYEFTLQGYSRKWGKSMWGWGCNKYNVTGNDQTQCQIYMGMLAQAPLVVTKIKIASQGGSPLAYGSVFSLYGRGIR